MPLIQGHAKAEDAATGFYSTTIDGSLRANVGDNAYLSRTPASAGNRKTWTFSCWVKYNQGLYTDLFSNGSAGQEGYSGNMYINTDGKFGFGAYDPNVNTYGYHYRSANRLLRDPSAWYHLVAVFDTTNSTAADRVRLYINGVRETDIDNLSSEGYGTVTQNYDGAINRNTVTIIGNESDTRRRYPYDGYLTEINFIDGQALDPTDFGEFKSGVWIPKAYSGSYGTNGFYLPLTSDANDASGNGNNWTANNLASTDYVLDSPTNNFAVLNVLDYHWRQDVTEGNLQTEGIGSVTSPYSESYASTIMVSSGKWYYEALIVGLTNGVTIGYSTGTITSNGAGPGYVIAGFNPWDDGVTNENSTTYGISAVDATVGDIYGVAYDIDGGTCKLYINGSLAYTISGLSSHDQVAASITAGFWNCKVFANFGQDSSFAGNKTSQGNTDDNGYGDFQYAPPSGYLALCTANLPDPVASMDPAQDGSPQDHFNTVLYTGNGSTQSITGVGFQPDLFWGKSRSMANQHSLLDVIRGPNSFLLPNLTNAEADKYEFDSFDSDGFTVSYDGSYQYLNNSGQTYVAWNWKAGTSYTPTVTGGFSSPSASINVDAGFGIYKFTGSNSTSSFTHGLGTTPDLFIAKNLDNTYDWAVWSRAETSYNEILKLNNSGAKVTKSGIIKTVDDTEIEVGSYAETGSNGDYIYYVFSNRDGFSKFGSYTGNGSTDGTFVYTGFRPAFVIVKGISANGRPWYLTDAARDPDNPTNVILLADANDAESSYGTSRSDFDFLSNGFKNRNTFTGNNASGETYIYMAFAENPFKYANAR
jgi:hypothetical protein